MADQTAITNDQNEEDLFLQIRTAHRLLAAYYQRLLPTIEQIANELDLKFYCWLPSEHEKPGNFSTNILNSVNLEDGRRYYNLFKSPINKNLFSSIISTLSSIPMMKGAFAYTFSGRFSELAGATVRTSRNTLISKLQYLKDDYDFEILNNKVKENSIYECSISKRNIFYRNRILVP